MELTVGPAREPSVGELEVEVVERKGRGHPDTICDGLAEEFSICLAQYELDHFGLVLHHNVDKALLWAGSARPAFGGGEVLSPMQIFLAGRATREFRGAKIPVERLALAGAQSWLRRGLHALDPERHVRLECLVNPGSPDLLELFLRNERAGLRLANDTSVGAGFAPRTDLENVVTAVETRLNSSEVKQACPELGEDIKVLGIRRKDRIRLTVSCAFIGRFLTDIADYLDKKERARGIAFEAARSITAGEISVELNTADDPTQGSVFLTVTGTSAEAGDDGQVGRGNRANGLITPYRPMALEAAAGKNALTHVGKLYQIASQRIAESLVSEIDGVTAAECYLVSRIGRPVADPQIADVRLGVRGRRSFSSLAPEVERIVRAQLDRLEGLWREILEGRVGVY